MDISFFDSDAFLIGYYVLTVGASLLLIKDTKKRVLDLKAGIGSIKYAPIAFGILAVYVLFAFEYVDQIPILNWSWLGYNIAFGPFAEQGMLGIIPFVPLLLARPYFVGKTSCCFTCFYISTILKNSISESQKKWFWYGR